MTLRASVLDDIDVLRLFGSQYGVATTAQLTALGLATTTVRRAPDRGVLVALLPGVFTLATRPVTFATNAMAAQLCFGDQSYLTGTTAARYHGFRGMPRSFVHVATFERSRLAAPKWIQHSCTPHVDPIEVWHRADGFRVADPHLTLATLARLFNAHRFAQAAEDAWHKNVVTPATLADYLASHRGSGQPGIARIEEWLSRNGHRQRASQSGFEFDVIDALRRADLPEPERQHPLVLLSGELIHLDIAWPDVMLAVEPGHSWFHRGDLRTRLDEARDRACGEIGWHVSRYDETARADLRAAAAEVARTHAVRRRQLRGGA